MYQQSIETIKRKRKQKKYRKTISFCNARVARVFHAWNGSQLPIVDSQFSSSSSSLSWCAFLPTRATLKQANSLDFMICDTRVCVVCIHNFHFCRFAVDFLFYFCSFSFFFFFQYRQIDANVRTGYVKTPSMDQSMSTINASQCNDPVPYRTGSSIRNRFKYYFVFPNIFQFVSRSPKFVNAEMMATQQQTFIDSNSNHCEPMCGHSIFINKCIKIVKQNEMYKL